MKANRKFRGEDEAVSPVIAVILMVAITVVLAATVYVWVSGFGGQSGSPAKTASLTSASALDNNGYKTYTVASATPGLKYSDLTLTVNGATWDLDTTANCATTPITVASTDFAVCRGTATQGGTAVVTAGDTIAMTGLQSGWSLKLLDTQANSVVYTNTIG